MKHIQKETRAVLEKFSRLGEAFKINMGGLLDYRRELLNSAVLSLYSAFSDIRKIREELFLELGMRIEDLPVEPKIKQALMDKSFWMKELHTVGDVLQYVSMRELKKYPGISYKDIRNLRVALKEYGKEKGQEIFLERQIIKVTENEVSMKR